MRLFKKKKKYADICRKRADEILESKSQLSGILEIIEKQTEAGKKEVEVGYAVNEYDMIKLKKMGFGVDIYTDKNGPTRIHWYRIND